MQFTKHYKDVNRLTVYNDTPLTTVAKCLYFEILAFHENNADIYASREYLADALGISTKSVTRATDLLVEIGWITKQHRAGTSNLYTVLLTPDQICNVKPEPTTPAPVSEVTDAMLENF